MTDGGARRRGRGQGQRLLYWFRTPPGVRVGRAPIDEQAMRLLEQHNPDVQFDWARLLKDVPSDAGARRERERDRDPRERDRRDRRQPRPGPRPPAAETTTAAAVPAMTPRVEVDATAEIADERAEAHAAIVLEGSEEAAIPDSVAVTHGEPLAADHAEYMEYAEAAAHSRPEPGEPEPGEPEEPVEPGEPVSAAAARLGAETVTRLRARYVQLVSRIAEKPLEDDARAELNARAERLNPDAWRTADEVAAALEQYESVFESLRADVGPHGSRRHR